MPVGRWARIHLASLEENRPDLLEKLRRSGQLDSYLRKIDQSATEEYENVSADLRRENPSTLSAFQNQQIAMTIDSQASELVIEGLSVAPLEGH